MDQMFQRETCTDNLHMKKYFLLSEDVFITIDDDDFLNDQYSW